MKIKRIIYPVILSALLALIVGCGGGNNVNPDPRLHMIDLVNDARLTSLLTPLTHDLDLTAVAQAHADDMVARDFVDHVNPDGHDAIWRVQNAGISFHGLGENISAGFDNMDAAHTSFMNSSVHRENILKPEATHIGVGYAYGTAANAYGQSLYICVLFMRE